MSTYVCVKDILLYKIVSHYLKNIFQQTNILFIIWEVVLPDDCIKYMKLKLLVRYQCVISYYVILEYININIYKYIYE